MDAATVHSNVYKEILEMSLQVPIFRCEKQEARESFTFCICPRVSLRLIVKGRCKQTFISETL